MTKQTDSLFDDNGWFHGTITEETARDCSHSGRCDEDVTYWRDQLNFEVPRDQAIDYLREFGAWEYHELQAKTDIELAETVLWIACGEIVERGEWLGLVH